MAGTVAAGLFNALRFAGASFMFSKFSHSDYSAEMKRHDLAVEKLQKARKEFNEREIQKRDKIAELREKMQDAEQDIHTTNEYLDSFRDKIDTLENQHNKEPSLDEFYTPSKKFEKYIFAFNVLLATGIGYGVYRLI